MQPESSVYWKHYSSFQSKHIKIHLQVTFIVKLPHCSTNVTTVYCVPEYTLYRPSQLCSVNAVKSSSALLTKAGLGSAVQGKHRIISLAANSFDMITFITELVFGFTEYCVFLQGISTNSWPLDCLGKEKENASCIIYISPRMFLNFYAHFCWWT